VALRPRAPAEIAAGQPWKAWGPLLSEQNLLYKPFAQNRAERAVEMARANSNALLQELKDVQAEQTERGMVLTLGDVLFDTGEAQLKPGAIDTVGRLADFLREEEQRSVIIEGHTDSVGEASFNQALSHERALAVKSVLAEHGIDGALCVVIY
jgi:outer membrane protein OmpA-like peptidoglycan-associated protein